MWKKHEQPVAPPPRAAEDIKAENASLAAFEGQLYSVALGGLERAKNGASVVQGASAAIAALYTGVLGFVFTSQDTPFPLRGVITPLFLGIAVVLATLYLAFITPNYKVFRTWPGGLGLGENVRERTEFVGEYVDRVVRRRSWALRAAVVALAVGLVGMALPFFSASTFDPPASKGESVSAAPAPTTWPTPDPVNTATPGAVDLAKIKYKAQVDEYRAHLHYSPAVGDPKYIDSVDLFFKLLWLGIALVVVLPILLWVIDWLSHKWTNWWDENHPVDL